MLKAIASPRTLFTAFLTVSLDRETPKSSMTWSTISLSVRPRMYSLWISSQMFPVVLWYGAGILVRNLPILSLGTRSERGP